MQTTKPGRGIFEDHWNATFWLLFLIAAAVFIAQVLINRLTPEILSGLLIILIGVYVMGAESRSRRASRSHTETARKLDDVLQWAGKSYDYTRSFKEKHESLIFNANVRIAEAEEKARKERDALARKLLDLENTLNRFLRDARDRKAMEESYMLHKPVLEKEASRPEPPASTINISVKPPSVVKEARPEPKPRPEPTRNSRLAIPSRLSDLNLRQSSSIDAIRKKGRITNREYAEMFKLTNKTAYRDLDKMVSSGLLKREGRGRNTVYVLGF